VATNKPSKGKDALASDYGYALAVIDSDPELTELFNQAWAAKKDKKVGDWSSALFVAKLRKTKWFKSRTAAQRQFYIDSNDPAQRKTLEAQLAAGRASVENLAKKAGAVLEENQVAFLARESKLNGWTDLQLANAINKHIEYKKDPTTGVKSLFGQAGVSETELRGFARSMGVSVTDDWIVKQAKLSSNTGDTKLAQDWIRARAKELYSPYANELDSSTLEDLSYNYRKSMADHLELDVDEIKVQDPTIAKFMSTPNVEGQKQSLWDFEKQIRKDPRWAKTKNAKESANSTVNSILSSFGLM
jgi:hypothetical protein